MPPEPAIDKDPNRQRAGDIWRAAIDPRGTLAHVYLEHRRLDLPDEAALSAIRFHPCCPFGEDEFPAMVCLVRGIVSNEPQAIHRTALSPDGVAIKRGGKTFRMSLGLVAGGAIKIDPNADVTMGLCVGEGCETVLAGWQMGLRPVWALLSTAGIGAFPILPGVDGLHIFRENSQVQKPSRNARDGGAPVAAKSS